MLPPVLTKNDKKARTLIIIFSAIVFAAVVALSRVKLNVDLGFDFHVFTTLFLYGRPPHAVHWPAFEPSALQCSCFCFPCLRCWRLWRVRALYPQVATWAR